MQLINTEGMHSVYLEASLALCSSCLNAPSLPTEVAESKHNLQTPDCLPHRMLPLADTLPCSDCCTGECTEKQVMKTLITTTQQWIQSNFSIYGGKKKKVLKVHGWLDINYCGG